MSGSDPDRRCECCLSGRAFRPGVALDEGTVAVLREHHREQAAERLALGADYGDLGLVFAQEDGSPLNPMIFTQRFQKASRDAGLPQIRLHDLSHGHVTYLMEAGVPLPVIAQRVGHSSVAVTGDTYSHVRPELRDDIARLGASLIFDHGTPRIPGSNLAELPVARQRQASTSLGEGPTEGPGAGAPPEPQVRPGVEAAS